ncbi:MAG: shikimate dehydrogenase [Clostridia bacterium]|jgi:shikimate dehydrogenase|nr:shikimate dehydrogenase [Clostridia bacterium]
MKEGTIEVTGKCSVCGIIGDPITHTLSPMIHNKLAFVANKEAIYIPFHVTSTGLKDAIKGAHALGIKGLNVTMPHKQELFHFVTHVDESAQKVGAINTLVYSEQGYIGYNTDYIGLKMSLEEEGVEWKDKNVAIIGSGGAAYAAYVSVAEEARSIHLFNRTARHAKALKEHMQSYFSTPAFVHEAGEDCSESLDIVIQTTRIGMGSYIGEMPSCTKAVLKEAKIAVDLIYHPEETQFLKYAKTRGCVCINGFGMLFYQAVEAFELMHHISCDKENTLKIKREILKYMEA